MGHAAESLDSSVTSTVQIDVDLDTSANPPVELDRNKKVKSGKKIKWKKASGAPDFAFTDFEGGSPPFDNVDRTDNKIECDFENSDPPDTKYKYTITVKLGKDSYTTTEQISDPTGDKPVIRNE